MPDKSVKNSQCPVLFHDCRTHCPTASISLISMCLIEPGMSISSVSTRFSKIKMANLFAFGFTSSRKRSIKRLFVISSVIFQICSFYT